MRSLTIRRLELRFEADRVTDGDDEQQSHQALELINRGLQQKEHGLDAEIIAHPDEIEIDET